jgi:predicted AlkP superfamily pyrophosphatase or phosphodiesterase
MPTEPSSPPLIVILAVGLTSRWLPHAPRLQALAQAGWCRPLREAIPAVTCTAQATLLTGKPPSVHGVVGNGWLFRDTMEVRFWQQANSLVQAEPVYATARRRAIRRGREFRCAKLFWWFNQGADVAFSVTPKPHYGCDGDKRFDITGQPPGLVAQLKSRLGPFPFPSFWGPTAGLPATTWIARCAASVACNVHPHLTLVYLPHLDYDPQRFGPAGTDMPRVVRELDDACAPLLSAAKTTGSRVWVVSEYGHIDVRQPVYLNRTLRDRGWLAVRPGPFGEMLDLFESRAFAVCDHQLAHVYVRDVAEVPRVRDALAEQPGVARLYAGAERAELDLVHPRSGELVALAKPDAWFAYPYWLDDRRAPDFARCVDIHRKPGYDPCELFFDPALWWPRGRAAWRLVQKKLGFRTRFDVVPLDAAIVRGSHGLAAADAVDRPVLIGDGPPPGADVAMTDVRDLVLRALDLADDARVE